MATQQTNLASQYTEMASSAPVVLDPALIPPGARYAPIYADAIGDGPLEAGRILFNPDPASNPLTFFEARGLMAHTGKTVGPLSILYQVIGKRFDPRQKADTDRLERAILKRLSEKAGGVWDNKKAPRIKFPPPDPQGRTLYAMAQFNDLAMFKACRGHDLQNGVQKLRHAFSGPPTSPRVFVISVHVDDTAHASAVALQLRSQLLRAATVHSVWALDRGNIHAGQALAWTGLILAVATLNGNPALPPQLHEWHTVVPWLEVENQQYPTVFNYRPAHCPMSQCRRPDVTFHPQSACRHIRCHNCGETGHRRNACPDANDEREEVHNRPEPRAPAAQPARAYPPSTSATGQLPGSPRTPATPASTHMPGPATPTASSHPRPRVPAPAAAQQAPSSAPSPASSVPAAVSSFMPATPPAPPRVTVAETQATTARRSLSTSVSFADPLVQERPRPLSTSSAPDLRQGNTVDKGKRRAAEVFSPSTSEDSLKAPIGGQPEALASDGSVADPVRPNSAQPRSTPVTRLQRTQRSPRKQICVGPRRELFEDSGSSDSQDTQRSSLVVGPPSEDAASQSTQVSVITISSDSDTGSQPAPAAAAGPSSAFRVPGVNYLVGNPAEAAQLHKRVLKAGDGSLRWETPTPQSSQSQ
ncbi:hypothetical protein V8E36_006505 [Tilletia maclaganii]